MAEKENVSADDKSTNESNTADAVAGEKEKGSTPSVEELMAEVTRLKAINSDVIGSRDDAKAKLRKIEDDKAKADAKALEEQGKFKELYEKEVEARKTLETLLQTKSADAALTLELQKAGALSVETALPLVDKSKLQFNDGVVTPESIADAITEVKDKHKIVFGDKPQAPNAKRPGEGANSGGYLDELKKLQSDPHASMKDFNALRSKYGMN